MKDEKDQTDDEIRMAVLCKEFGNLREQRHTSRVANIGTELNIANLNSLLMGIIEKITELERKGLKRVDVKPEDQIGSARIAGSEENSVSNDVARK